jgi:ubiquinone/menaquinone biosynthesis C-methylase UbiE
VSCAHKEGLKVIQGLFPNVSLGANKYDAVLMSHVLEHIKDPVDFVNGLKKILKKNGILMFIQTNYLGIIPKVQGSDWYAWVPDQHYWHFSPKGLTAFLDKMGFKKIKLEYSNIVHPPSLLLTISNIIPYFGDQFLLLVRN